MSQNTINRIPLIESAHYLLRGIEIQDAESMFVFMSDQKTMKYITPHPVRSLKEMQASIKTSLDQFQQEKEIPWSIVDKQTREVIGMFRFHKLSFRHRKAEMGVVLRNDYQQKGVMTEVLREILKFGFIDIGLNRIVGDIFLENQGSRRLLETYGFQKEGVLRQTDFDGTRFYDTVVYSMLRTEYLESWHGN